MSKFSNPGTVDVEKAAEGILASGGGITSRTRDDGTIHNTAYSKDENRRLSWDEHPDGKITDVHTSKNGRSYTGYGK